MSLKIRDSAIKNLVTLLGSEADANANNQLGDLCEIDLVKWRERGGLAKKITDFWPENIGTGLTIAVGAKSEGRNSSITAKKLQEWLQQEFEALQVLPKFIEAAKQCQVMRAAPIVVETDGKDPLYEQLGKFDRVTNLNILDPGCLTPKLPELILSSTYNVDHDRVKRYVSTLASINPVAANELEKSIHASRVLAIRGDRVIGCSSDNKAKEWGRPRISSAVAHAANSLEAALAYCDNLLAAKNTPVLGIANLLEKLAGDDSGDYAKNLQTSLSLLQGALKILNVQAIDKEEMSLSMLERNLTGCVDVIDRRRDHLLAHCPGIPETYLFGRMRAGSLGNSQQGEQQQINATAERLYQQEWLPYLKKLVAVLLLSRSCPAPRYDLSAITITRTSGYSIDPLTSARTRSEIIKGDVMLIDKKAMTPEEARQRMTGKEAFQLNLPLAEKSNDLGI